MRCGVVQRGMVHPRPVKGSHARVVGALSFSRFSRRVRAGHVARSTTTLRLRRLLHVSLARSLTHSLSLSLPSTVARCDNSRYLAIRRTIPRAEAYTYSRRCVNPPAREELARRNTRVRTVFRGRLADFSATFLRFSSALASSSPLSLSLSSSPALASAAQTLPLPLVLSLSLSLPLVV